MNTHTLPSVSTLRGIRQRLGLTQVVVSRWIKVSQPDISNYERGLMIPPKHAERIVRRLKRKFPHVYWVAYLEPDDLNQPWDQTVQSLHSRVSQEGQDV